MGNASSRFGALLIGSQVNSRDRRGRAHRLVCGVLLIFIIVVVLCAGGGASARQLVSLTRFLQSRAFWRRDVDLHDTRPRKQTTQPFCRLRAHARHVTTARHFRRPKHLITPPKPRPRTEFQQNEPCSHKLRHAGKYRFKHSLV